MAGIIGRFAKTISAGIDTVGTKSKEWLEISKIKARVYDLGARRRRLIEELGEAAYQLARRKTLLDARLQSKVDQIADVDRQIAAAQSELELARSSLRSAGAREAQDVEPLTGTEPVEEREPEPPQPQTPTQMQAEPQPQSEAPLQAPSETPPPRDGELGYGPGVDSGEDPGADAEGDCSTRHRTELQR